jgi:VIT1/CCC1 family predicted Fe2+/Mn2+ transporter
VSSTFVAPNRGERRFRAAITTEIGQACGVPSRQLPPEIHKSHRIGWLRAAVLGAQDGIGSTSSLLIGVVAASNDRTQLLIAGIAAVVAGAMSMAAGEYTSVSSQRDTEQADMARETEELAEFPDVELEELTQIYEQRGLDRPLARQVAIQLTKADALGAHMRDELGITVEATARPLQAAVVSAAGFLLGSSPAVLIVAVAPPGARLATIAVVALALLAIVGATGARLGGANVTRAATRVTVIGGIAMAVAALVGSVVGAAV